MEGRFKLDGNGVAICLVINWAALNSFAKALITTIIFLIAVWYHPAFQQALHRIGLS
jgi:hypothetical protein